MGQWLLSLRQAICGGLTGDDLSREEYEGLRLRISNTGQCADDIPAPHALAMMRRAGRAPRARVSRKNRLIDFDLRLPSEQDSGISHDETISRMRPSRIASVRTEGAT